MLTELIINNLHENVNSSITKSLNPLEYKMFIISTEKIKKTKKQGNAIIHVIFIKNDVLNLTSLKLFLAYNPLKFGTIAVASDAHSKTGKFINVLIIPLLMPYKFVACKLENPALVKMLIIKKLSKKLVIGTIMALSVAGYA